MAGLFLLDQSGDMTALTHADYDSEDLMQELLAQHHDLLGGDQMGGGIPRKWMFVAREAPVPDSEESTGRWSVDHLFLDQDAIPTFVEIKRASDTRVRREVVGQMLDYAANGLKYWPVETIQRFLAVTGVDPDERLAETFGPGVDTADYWLKLKDNLSDGKIRLLFVADKIPSELLAVVEFLNSHMDHTEVLAVEIPQFVGEGGQRILAPRVLGQTQAAIQQRKAGIRTSRTWDEQSYFSAANAELSGEELELVRRYHDWIRERGWRVVFGKGTVNGSFWGKFQVDGKDCVYPVTCYSSGTMEFGFASLSAPFDDDSRRREFIRRMNSIPGADFSEDATTAGNKYPKRPVSILNQAGAFEIFTNTLLWYQSEAEKAVNSVE